MNETRIEYIKHLKPSNVPDGKLLVEEGIKKGKEIPLGKSRFLEEKGCNTYNEYREKLINEGKINWQMLLGLGTLEEEVEGVKKAYEFVKKSGMEFSTVQHVTNQLACLPKEYRKGAPGSTAFMVENAEDRVKCMEAAPLQQVFEDHTLSCPNSIETTVGAIMASSPRVGIVSQYVWDYYGFTDDVKRFSDMMVSIGMVKAHKEEGLSIDTYLDDGIPSYFIDCVSYVGYALLEDYIISNLCGANLTISYGGLLSEVKNRMAVGLAIDKLLSKNGRRALSYINGSTNWQWEEYVVSNYGPSVLEMFIQILVEKKYKLGLQINPVSISEKITVPTLEALLDILSVGIRTEEFASDWEDLICFDEIEKRRDVMAEEGKKWFENALAYFEAAGIDINNPLEMFMVLKNFNYSMIEEMFHPTTQKGDKLEPFYPTVLGKQTADLRDEIIKDLEEKGLGNSLDGKKVVCVSADGHSYGLVLIDNVYKALGANVVNGGTDMNNPSVVLDLADEEGTEYISISAHNGQILEYAEEIVALAAKRQKSYKIYMGGNFKAILPGDIETSDVTSLVNKTGVFGDNSLENQIRDMIQ